MIPASTGASTGVKKDHDTTSSKRKDPSSFDHSLVLARALGETTQESAASILSKEKKTKISIVVSHCESPVNWIPSFMADVNVQVSDITIVSKCGKEVEGINSLEMTFGVSAKVKRLPNVGRCDHSYANWVRDNYSRIEEEFKTLSEEDVNEDLVLFIKDNNYHVDSYVPFPEVFTAAVDSGFGCVMKIGYELFLDCQGENCRARETDTMGISLPGDPYTESHLPLELHYKGYIDAFNIPKYTRIERDENLLFKSQYDTLKEWRDDMGLVFPDSEYINVCYGGAFLFQKRGVLLQSESAWANLEIGLSRGDNIQEGHFAERSWASIIGPEPRDLPLDTLSKQVHPFVSYWRDNLIGDHGRLYVPKESPLLVAPSQDSTIDLLQATPIDTSPIPVFYNIFAPSGDVEYAKSIVKEQMDMSLPQHEFLIRTIGTPVTIPNTKLLRHDDEGDEVETLELLWEHCNEHPSDKVVYIHSKGSFHYNEDNNRLRRFLTRGALSNECAQLPDTCNVCSSRMSPMPHPHTSGNMWLARCEYVKNLPRPSKFADMMSRHVEEMHVVTQDCWPCFGLHRFSAEHWIHAHPTVKPCDLSTDESFVADYETTPDVDFEIDLKPAPRFELDVYGGPPPCMFGQYAEYRLREYKGLFGEDVEIPLDWFGWKLLKTNSKPLRIPLAEDAICRLQHPETF
jgi:hypothetical protein